VRFKFRLARAPLLTSLECDLPLNVLENRLKRKSARPDHNMDFLAKDGAQEDPIEAPPPRVAAAAPELEPGAPTDLELMLAIQKADPEALSLLYDRYNGIVKALILRVIHNEAEADDLLQEIFMEIWNQAKNFSAQKGKPLGWMVTLARRRAIDGLRKKQAYARAGERLQTETEQQPDAWVHNATEEEITFGDTRVLVRRVINTLPVAQQEAINLAFFSGMSQREIAAKTNTPLGTVKTRLELGLKKIYDGLKELRDEL
jgi:RNA polymerase sigma-70 factor (ECF subfamily)